MTLIERISADMMVAYKSKNTEAKALLGVIKGTATKVNKVPEDSEVISTIKSMIKGHNDSVEKYNAPTLTPSELEILNGYLPQQMSETQIKEAVNKIISETGETNMGKIMGAFGKEYNGKADNKLVLSIIKETLVIKNI